MNNNTVISLFSPKEMEVLSGNFRLTAEESPDKGFSIPSADLLDHAKCLSYMDLVTAKFETSSRAAAASQFSKRYAYMTMASGLYAMTMFDKGLGYSVENCHLESVHREGNWLPEVRLNDWQVTEPADDAREEWRDRMISSIFAGNIAKVWRSISKAAKLPMAILWENTAISVYWLYEKRMGEGADERQLSRIREDYRYLLSEAPAHLFGEKENPLAKFDSPKCITPASERPIRIRKTCCLLYQLPEHKGDYCITCPKLQVPQEK